MEDQPYRGPAAWMRENAFILILVGAVAVALIGDRAARSGVNPADNPQFAQAKPAETPPADAQAAPAAEQQAAPAAEPQAPQEQKNAETQPPPGEDKAATGGSAQESTATAQPPAATNDTAKQPPTADAKQDTAPAPPAPKAGAAGSQ